MVNCTIKVQGGRQADATKNPADLLPYGGGSRTREGVAARLDEAERQERGKDLLRAQWRWPVGMPLCRPMGDGLWEIRTDLPTKRTSRVPLPPALGGAARVHQENAGHARFGSGNARTRQKELER